MYGKYTLFYKSPKTGDITHICANNVVPGLSSGGGEAENKAKAESDLL